MGFSGAGIAILRVLVFVLCCRSNCALQSTQPTVEIQANASEPVISDPTAHALTSILLFTFAGYRSVQVRAFKVPQSTSVVSWSHAIKVSDHRCPNRTINIAYQYNAIPVINADNSSHNSTIFIAKSYASVEMPAADDTHFEYGVHFPLPGIWYLAAVLAPEKARGIHPRDLTRKCTYSMGVIPSVWPDYRVRTLPTDKKQRRFTLTPDANFAIFKFYVPQQLVRSFNVSVVCDNQTDCPLVMLSRDRAQPHVLEYNYVNDSQRVDCSQGYCSILQDNPSTDHYFVSLSPKNNFTLPGNVSFEIAVDLIYCEGRCASAAHKIFRQGNLGGDDERFLIYYERNDIAHFSSEAIVWSNTSVEQFSFDILPQDVGKTLDMSFSISDPSVYIDICTQPSSWNSTVSVSNRSQLLRCHNGEHFSLSHNESSYFRQFAYPSAGKWLFAISARCVNVSSCPETVLVNTSIFLHLCFQSDCGRFGKCLRMISDDVAYGACQCVLDYRGMDCTDASHALSRSQVIGRTLFLTLSNFVLMVPVFIACRRRLIIEAMVYTFTMLFSTFYHACDTKVYEWCIAPYDSLQYCDFMSSVMAAWTTVTAMSGLTFPFKAIFNLFGMFVVSIATSINRFGSAMFFIPTCFPLAVLLVSWAVMIRSKRQLYPNKRFWLVHVLPGIFLAVLGLSLYAALETEDNYFYVHSLWHMLMATAISFLLPISVGKLPELKLRPIDVRHWKPNGIGDDSQMNGADGDGDTSAASLSALGDVS